MATWSWADGDFAVDSADGASATTSYKAYIREIDGFEVQRGDEDYTTLGSAWEASVLTGVRAGQPFTVKGLYDPTVAAAFNGTHVATRTVTWTFGTGNTASFEAWITSFKRVPKAKGRVDYEATFKPTGTVTDATA